MSKISSIIFRNRRVFVKRDDKLILNGVRGNKARKFASLSDLKGIDGIVSYGGAQSNAMLALANVSRHNAVPFVYVSKPVPERIKHVQGNFQEALGTGMRHIQLHPDEFKETFMESAPLKCAAVAKKMSRDLLELGQEANILYVPQGGAWPGAEVGIMQLAEELRAQIYELREADELKMQRPILFLSAGTGTTAFFLAQYLSGVAQVVAVPASGDERYLMKQMQWLQAAAGAKPIFPDVLCPRIRSSFADIREDKFLIWQEMERTGISFDLIYAPKTWEEVFLAIDEGRLNTRGEDLIYYHSGGLEGNASMLQRFERKGLVNHKNLSTRN